MNAVTDIDATETAEWLEALDGVLRTDGPERARELMETLLDHARTRGASVVSGLQTPYVNTLPASADPTADDATTLEQRLRAYVRWNAIAMVLRANAESSSSGATSRATSPRRRCTRRASTTSGTRRRTSTGGICSTSRGTPRRGSMRARSSRVA
jgi:pyruvate dehydrogenase complex dehydrogenase (E1) component